MQNNFYRQAKIRLALIIVLTTMLVLALSIATYAWFKDSIDIPNPTVVTTGKIDVTLTSYKKTNIAGGSTAWITEELYNSFPDTQNANKQESALLSSNLYTLDLNNGYDEMFFVVKKNSESINVEMVLSFLLNTDDEFINGFTYYLTKIEVTGDKTVAQVLEEESNKPVSSNNSLYNINGDAISATLRKEKAEEYVVFRLICAYVGGDLTENAYTDKYYPIQVNFSVGQIGSITGESTGNTWRVSTEAELRNALLNYQSNDNINVIKDITYNTDLVLDHPVQLYVRGVTLKINGNFNVTFADTGEFLIDTQNSGKIIVAQVGQSGNFIIDLPNAHISIVGTGNNAETKGDIYVQNRFSVLVSYSRGLDIYRSNIYHTSTASNADTSTIYKDIYVGQSTFITVANRTTVGTLIATSGTTLIKVVNNGTIQQADFSAMIFDITNNPHSPQLTVENYGTVGMAGQNYSVILGSNSRPCYTEDGLQQSGNTRLIKKLGAQYLQGIIAIVGGTTRYYIETDTQVEYVIPVEEGDYTDIIVNYANLYDENSVEITNTTLLDVLKWYFNGTKETDMALVQKMRVVCYNGKVLTHDDYNTINTLTNLVSLDLSSCTSKNDTFGVLLNLTKLTELLLTEDKVLPQGALAVTQIQEITVPSSYIDVTADSFLNATGYVKFVHLKGFNRYPTLIPNAQQYFLVADNDLVEQYRSVTDDHALKARVFLEAEHYGDYFVRIVNNSSVEIVAYVGDNFDYSQESIAVGEGNDVCFNFNTFIVPGDTALGHTYYVIGYGDYSFYNKLTAGAKTDLIVGEVAVVGQYAFFGAKVFNSINLNSTTGMTIDTYAFGNTTITNGITLSTNGALLINEYAFYATTAKSLTVSAQSVYIAPNAFDSSNTMGLDITTVGNVEIAQKAFVDASFAKGTTVLPFTINAGGNVIVHNLAFGYNTTTKRKYTVSDFTITATNIEFLSDGTDGKSYAFYQASISGAFTLTAVNTINIGSNAFQNISNFTSMDFVAETIIFETNAFYASSAQVDVNITAKNVTMSYAFVASSITGFTLNAEESVSIANVFARATRVEFIDITAPKITISAATANATGLKRINLEGETITLSAAAFSGASAVENIDIKGVTVSADVSAFVGCSSVDLLNIEAETLSFTRNVGDSTTNIKTFNIDCETVTFDNNAFNSALIERIYITGAGTMGTHAFANNIALLEVVAPGITSIRINAFSGCSNLLAVVMPSLVDIGASRTAGDFSGTGSFEGCNKLKYVETGVIAKTEGNKMNGEGTPTINSQRPAFSGNIDLYVVNTAGLSLPTYDWVVNLFSVNTYFGMNLLVPRDYQQIYRNSRFGTKYDSGHEIVIDNTDYVGNPRYMNYNTTTQRWEDCSAYVIDDISRTITLAQYVYHQKANGEYQLLCCNQKNITQDELVVPDSVWIDGAEYVISSLGNYAYRTTKVNVNKLSLGARIEEIGEHAFGKWNNSENGLDSTMFTGYISSSKDYRTIAKMVDIGTLPNVVGFKRDTSFYLTGVEELMGSAEYIDSQAFSGLVNLTHVNFPNVTALTDREFINCTGLESVDFASLKTVSGRAFAGCTSLATVNMTEVTTIADGAFMGTPLMEINGTIFPKLQTIGSNSDTYGAFQNCTFLRRVDFFDETSKLTTVAGPAFAGCTFLQYVKLYSVTTLGANAFRGLTALREVYCYRLLELTNGEFNGCTSLELANFEFLTSISNLAFSGCRSLTTIVMPNVTEITNGAFMGSGLETIGDQNLPKLTTIGSDLDEFGVFENCSNLAVIDFYADDSKLTTISGNAFKGCEYLTSVMLSKVRALNPQTFSGNQFLQKVHCKTIATLNDGEFADCISLVDVYMPNLVSIRNGAFRGSGLTEISNEMFPNLTKIGNAEDEVGTFEDCVSLETINFDDNSQLRNIIGNQFVGCTRLKYVTIEFVDAIETSMFRGKTALVEVNMASLTQLTDAEFANCTALTTAYFARCTTVSGGAFENCTALTTISMPLCKSVTDRAFKNTGLIELTDTMFPVLASITSSTGATGDTGDVFNGAFCGCTKLKTINLSSVVTIGAYAFMDCTATGLVATFANLNSIGSHAFGQTYTTYPSGVKSKVPGITKFVAPNLPTIGGSAFRGANYLKEVDVPMVEIIGDSTFQNCGNLKTVNMPNVVTINATGFNSTGLVEAYCPLLTSTGHRAFINCKSLKSVYMPELTGMASYMFNGCQSLTTLDLPKVTSISSNVFEGCTSLKTLTLASLPSLGANTLLGCTNLETLTLASLTTIASGAFSHCPKLTSLSLDNLTTLQGYALKGCESLTELNLPNLTTLQAYAFEGCESLTELTLPKIVDIGLNAFTNSYITTLTLPNITALADEAFSNFVTLTTLSLPQVATIGSYVFSGCTGLIELELPSLTEISENAFSGSYIQTLSLPNITNVGDNAFADAMALTTVYLPKVTTVGANIIKGSSIVELYLPRLTTVSNSSFRECSTLTTVSLPVLTSLTIDGTVVGELLFYKCTSLVDVSLPVLTYLPKSTFRECTALTTISLPMVTSLGDTVFYDCTSLVDVSLPNLTTVGESAFYGCTRLTTISLPVLTSLAKSMFYGCTALTTISLPMVTSLGDYSFYGCKALKSVYLPSVTSTGTGGLSGIFQNCISLQYVKDSDWTDGANMLYIPNALTLSGSMFSGCTGLIEVDLSSVTSIGAGASVFNGCKGLKKVNLPSVTSNIAGSDFSGCSSLEDVNLPLAKEIATSAFINCTSLKYISLASATKAYGKAFEGCTALKYVYLPNVATVGTGTFKNCKNLIVIYLPSLTSIGDSGAFSGCTNLKVAHFGKLASTIFERLITNIASVCVIFEDGNITEPTDSPIRATTIVKGAYADNYITADGYGCTEVADLASEIIFADANGDAITYDELFGDWTVSRVPVAVYQKAMTVDESLTLLKQINVRVDEGETYVVRDTINRPNGAGAYPVVAVASFAMYGIGATAGTLTFGDGIKVVGDYILDANAKIYNLDYNLIERVGALQVDVLSTLIGRHVVEFSQENTFSNNGALSEISFDSLQVLPSGAFYNCIGLTGVRFDSVEYVDGGDTNAVFGNCENLTEVFFGANLQSITGNVFNGCIRLQYFIVENDSSVVTFSSATELSLPSGAILMVSGNLLLDYNSSAWYNLPCYDASGNQSGTLTIESFQVMQEVDDITYYFDYLGDNMEIAYISTSNYDCTTLQLPTYYVVDVDDEIPVVSISRSAMQVINQLTNLETLTLPTYLRYFDNKDLLPVSLKDFAIDNANSTTYCVVYGVLYTYGGVLVSYPAGKFDEEYTLPNSVTIISGQAFVNTRYLKVIWMNERETPPQFVGEDIFANSSVEYIVTPNGESEWYAMAVLTDKKVETLFVDEDIYIEDIA